MANTAQARKRVRQAEKSNAANASYRSMTRTYVKKTINAIKASNREEAMKAPQPQQHQHGADGQDSGKHRGDSPQPAESGALRVRAGKESAVVAQARDNPAARHGL